MEIAKHRGITGVRLERTVSFLNRLGLDWDPHIEVTVTLTGREGIIATGSRQRNVLKCIGVAPEHEGEGLTATVVSELIKDAYAQGHTHLFLFTKPANADKFGALGFYPVAATRDITLLENRRGGIDRFVQGLEHPEADGAVGAIVANCNPFTNGHRYLIEKASGDCALLHLFILSEDRSAFPADVRLELAKRGTADLRNVIVHPTSDYLISSATFPDYFIKDKIQAANSSSELDLAIFAERFAPALGIARRYVGSEPNDPVTANYNRQMHLVLPRYGIEVVELPRCEKDGAVVSASTVRALLARGKLEQVRELVPESTFACLQHM